MGEDQAAYPTASAAAPLKPKYKRRVVMLKPLVELPSTPLQRPQPLSKLRLIRSGSHSSSSDDTSPTSVLPYTKHQSNSLKAGQSQLHRALTTSSSSSLASSPPEVSPPATPVCQQPVCTDSWTSRHFVYDVASAAQPIPRYQTSAAPSTDVSTLTALLHKPVAQHTAQPVAKASRQPAKQASHAKHGTLETAWRWRFKRQWRRAQAEVLMHDSSDPSHDQADDDPWHMAFQMIQAGNAFPAVGVPLPDHDCYSGPAASPLLDTEDDDINGLFEFDSGSAEAALQQPSKPLPALGLAASKARELLRLQAGVHAQACSHYPQDHTHPLTAQQCGISKASVPSWIAQGVMPSGFSKPATGKPQPMGMHTSISSQMLAPDLLHSTESAAPLMGA